MASKVKSLGSAVVSLGLTLVLAGCAAESNSSTKVNLNSSSPKSPSLERSFQLVATGDILLHERTWTQARRDGANGKLDFYPQLAPIASYTSSADFAMCHLETPLAVPDVDYSGYPIFNSPPQIIDAVKKLGFDFCEQTSNHSLDKGEAGIVRTLDYLDREGIAHTGSYRSAQEAATPTLVTVAGTNGNITVGVVAASYGFNGFDYPAGKEWLVNQIDVAKLIADAQAARAAGAEVVIVHLHWGIEYSTNISEEQHLIAQQLAESGAVDLILGDHAHVVQPIQKIGNMWVAYGHGNLVAAHREPETEKSEGLLTRWTFTENPDKSFRISHVEYAPLLITDAYPVRVLNVSQSLAEKDWGSSSEKRLTTALKRTSEIVTSLDSTPQLLTD